MGGISNANWQEITASHALNADFADSAYYSTTAQSASYAVSASNISGSIEIDGGTGYFPRFFESSLSSTSSLYEDSTGVYVFAPLFATSSRAITSSYAFTASYFDGIVPTSSQAITASYSISSSHSLISDYSLTSNTANTSISSAFATSASYSQTSSYISGSIEFDGISGYYPKFFQSTLSSTSSIYEDQSGIIINVPLFATSSNSITSSYSSTASFVPLTMYTRSLSSYSTSSIFSSPSTIYNCVFINYLLTNAGIFRAGNIVILYTTSSIELSETCTKGFGDSSGVIFIPELSASTAKLLALNGQNTDFQLKYHFTTM